MILAGIVLMLLIAACVTFGVLMYVSHERLEKYEKNVDSLKTTIASLARDIDLVIGNLQYDPANATDITTTNDKNQFAMRTNRVNEIMLGNGSISYDTVANSMSIGNSSGGNTSILLAGDTIKMSPKVTIGNTLQLRPNNDKLQICQVGGGCRDIVTQAP